MSIMASPDFHHVPTVSFALYAPVKNRTRLQMPTDVSMAVLTLVKKKGMMGMMLPSMLAANTMSAVEKGVLVGLFMWSSSAIMVRSQRFLDDATRSTTLARSFPLMPF